MTQYYAFKKKKKMGVVRKLEMLVSVDTAQDTVQPWALLEF